MRIAFIARSTLYKIQGGSAVQILETAKHLRKLGVEVNIFLSHEKVDYEKFDLLHFFDLIRPSNILYHIKKSDTPFVISPLLVDYSEFDKQHRKGFSGFVLRRFSSSANEYIKTISRWVLNKDKLKTKAYIWKGHRRSILEILEKACMIFPNSLSEYNQLIKLYGVKKPFSVVPNGIDQTLFTSENSDIKDEKLVVCAARIEGIKNQLNLIKALNNTDFRLVLIGDASPNQKNYYRDCRKIAAANIEFTGRLEQDQLVTYYKKAKVHVLPSWFETCGLSSLEAAAMGCNIVITDKGYTRDYFEKNAFYCDPEKPESIFSAVNKASQSRSSKELQQRINEQFTWQQAAVITLEGYKKIVET